MSSSDPGSGAEDARRPRPAAARLRVRQFQLPVSSARRPPLRPPAHSMKPSYVNQLEPNQTITNSFLVQSKEVREKKTGEPYLSLLLADKSGRIDAKMWDNVAEVLDAFDRDDFVKVKGLVQLHQNRPQLTIHKIRRSGRRRGRFRRLLPVFRHATPKRCGASSTASSTACATPISGRCSESFLDDPEIAVRYRRAPAAKSIHHAYLGGLLEHVLSLCNLSRAVAASIRTSMWIC